MFARQSVVILSEQIFTGGDISRKGSTSLLHPSSFAQYMNAVRCNQFCCFVLYIVCNLLAYFLVYAKLDGWIIFRVVHLVVVGRSDILCLTTMGFATRSMKMAILL